MKAHRLCVSLNSRLESNKEEEESAIVKTCPGAPRFVRGALFSSLLFFITLGLELSDTKVYEP